MNISSEGGLVTADERRSVLKLKEARTLFRKTIRMHVNDVFLMSHTMLGGGILSLLLHNEKIYFLKENGLLRLGSRCISNARNHGRNLFLHLHTHDHTMHFEFELLLLLLLEPKLKTSSCPISCIDFR